MLRSRWVLPLLAAITPACSVLVQFVDAPDAGDGSSDAQLDVLDAARDTAGYDGSHVCTGLGNGYYCGYNGLNGNPPPDWLVFCDAGHPTIRVCDAGCLAFPSGTPDGCNECPGFANGSYCGSQFATYGPYNAPYLLTCKEGIAAIQGDCTNGCQPGPGDASCK